MIDRSLIDVFPSHNTGYVDGDEDTADNLFAACGDSARAFPPEMMVPKHERKAMAEANDRNRTWGLNYLSRYTHQGGSHECAGHAVTRSGEGARNRLRGIIYADGPKKGFRYPESSKGDVYLSPLSIYLEANPSQWGGSNIVRNVNIAQRRGWLPDRVQPAEYGLRHTLHGSAGGKESSNQSIGPWVSLRNLPDGWEETAKHFRPLEIIIIENEDQAVSALLHGGVIAYGRRGHAVAVAGWKHDQDIYPYADSYDRVLYDSAATFRSACRGAVCVWTTTQPQDWMKPAG